jgi:hypothetical protein
MNRILGSNSGSLNQFKKENFRLRNRRRRRCNKLGYRRTVEIKNNFCSL